MAISMEALLKIAAQTTGSDGIQRMANELGGLGKSASATEKSLKGFSSNVAGLASVMGMLTPLFSIAGIAELGNKALEAGDQFWDLSQKTGVSVEALSRFSKAAKLNGTDIDGVATAMGKLSKGMLEAATTGKGPVVESLKVLGVSATDASGRLRGADQVMLDVADRFKALPDGAEKTAIAMNLFGKAGKEMIPMLNQGGEAIDSLGGKMTTAFAEKADEYHDNLTRLGGAVSGLGIVIAEQLLPTLIDVTGRTIDFVKSISSSVEQNTGMIQVVLKGLNIFGTATGDLFQTLIGTVGIFSRVLGRLSMFDFKGVVDEVKTYFVNYTKTFAANWQQFGDIINGTAGKMQSTSNAAAASTENITARLKDMHDQEEIAKQKQAQWEVWVSETELSYKRLQFTVNQTSQAVSGQLKITDARIGAEMAINNAAKTNLQIQLSRAKNDQERLAITQRIADLDIANARLQLELTKAQIEATTQELALQIQKAKVAQAQAAAELEGAKAHGVKTEQYQKALEAQSEVVQQTQNEYNIAKQVAPYKLAAAEATFNAAVAQANASVESERMKASSEKIANNTAGAANNIRSMAVSMSDAATAATTTADAIRNALNYAAQGKSMVIGLGGVHEAPAGYGAFAAGKNGGTSPYAPRLSGFAVGAYVTGPTPALVGEGGEPEYVVPSSRMAAASTAYLSGARGPAVLAGSAGSTQPPQVNITTGPVLEFNGEQYVTLQDFQRGLQQTAEGVIGRLRTPSARLALGLR